MGATRTVPLSPGRYGMPRNAVIVRAEDTVPRAYVNICMHLPIPLDAGRGRFFDRDGKHLICRTHGALYRLEDGMCIEGPCNGMALEPLSVVVDDGVIYVEDAAAMAPSAPPLADKP